MNHEPKSYSFNSELRHSPRGVHGSPEPRWIQGQSPEPHMVQGQSPEPRWIQGQSPEPRWIQGQSPEPHMVQGQSPEPHMVQGELWTLFCASLIQVLIFAFFRMGLP